MTIIGIMGSSFLVVEKIELGKWRRGTSSIECGQVQTTLGAWEGATKVQERCSRSVDQL
jgi:hypothetical protein